MREKILAAIAGAITAYLEEESRARLGIIRYRPVSPLPHPWALSGRDEIMRLRLLWQRRITSR